MSERDTNANTRDQEAPVDAPHRNRRTEPSLAPLKSFMQRPDVADRLAALRQLSPGRFISAMLFNYTLIAAAIVGTVTLQPVLLNAAWDNSGLLGGLAYAAVLAMALLLIAARQHALLVLLHEGAHRTISRNRWINDGLSDLLCGAPLLIGTRNYRSTHLVHHQQLNTEHDPDWRRKIDQADERAQWLFPAQMPLWRLLASLYGHSVTYLLKSLSDLQRPQQTLATTRPTTGSQVDEPPTQAAASSTGLRTDDTPSDRTLKRLKYLIYAVVGITLTVTSQWLNFLLFWVLPMFFVLPLLMRIRSIAEHFALRHDHPLRETRTVRAGWLERLLLAPHNIGLHIDHHLLASVPFYHLPQLHELLLECDYFRTHAHINDGYFLPTRTKAKNGASTGAGANARNKPTFRTDLYGQPSARLHPLMPPALTQSPADSLAPTDRAISAL